MSTFNRRAFLSSSIATATALGLSTSRPVASEVATATSQKLPRWRGFNLLEKFNGANEKFREDDFAGIAELGFDFVRLPMDYRAWTDPSDWTVLKEEVLKEVDDAVALGEKYKIHVMVNFHRAPGYTVAQPAEVKDLWKDPEAQRVCGLHWARFAERYRGVPNERVSFNLVNEPSTVGAAEHRTAMGVVCAAIREKDPARLIVCDGRLWGRTPPEELLDLHVASSTRGYEPMQLTHYRASWVNGADKYAVPTWPLKLGDVTIDRENLRKYGVDRWKSIESEGMGVMVGEFGAHNQTPPDVVLAWMKDCVSLWNEAGWGYALWNYRGSFGILDSERADVAYVDWNGHKLDRAMLNVLRAET